MLKLLHQAREKKEENAKALQMLSYFSSLREWGTVRNIISNIGRYTSDERLQGTFKNFFLLDRRATKYFGIAEDIVGSMSNMVFGGSVDIKTKDEDIQEKINEIMKDGYFLENVNNAYKAAIATNGRAYLFMELTSDFVATTNQKVKDKFVKYTVIPEFELKIDNLNNVITRTIFRTSYNEIKKKDELYTFEYSYQIHNGRTYLSIAGFDEDDNLIDRTQTLDILGIDDTYFEYDFIPFGVVNVGEGMLPNIIYIENSLAKNLYYQDKDLEASQTQQYIPEDLIEEVHIGKNSYDVFDDLETKRVIKSSIDGKGITTVEGKSAITTIERNLALNVVQATLDAKINPISIGYLLTDRLGGNTDVGADKERASIRLRETHVDKLKTFIQNEMIKRLKLEGIELLATEMSTIFAQYITPNIESLTNTLAKQRQFGLKSAKRAVAELNREELMEDELIEEVEEIRKDNSQMDLNPMQSKQIKSGIDNRLKSEGLVD